MIAENLRRAGLDAQDAGCWKSGWRTGRSWQSIPSTPHPRRCGRHLAPWARPGLVRPYSHEAYIDTVRICVKSHHICPAGRQWCSAPAGARSPARNGGLPSSARNGVRLHRGLHRGEPRRGLPHTGCARSPWPACAGKLCKYAAGFENTHAHKVSQDMDLLRAEVRKHLPGEEALHGCTGAQRFRAGSASVHPPERIGPVSYDASPAPPSGSSARRCGEDIGAAAARLRF